MSSCGIACGCGFVRCAAAVCQQTPCAPRFVAISASMLRVTICAAACNADCVAELLVCPMSRRAQQKRKNAEGRMEVALAEESISNITKYLREHPDEAITMWVQLSGKAFASGTLSSATTPNKKPWGKPKDEVDGLEEDEQPESSSKSGKIPNSRRRIEELSQNLM